MTTADLIAEEAEQSARYDALKAFVETPEHDALGEDERMDQHRQLAFQKSYLDILQRRLRRAGV